MDQQGNHRDSDPGERAGRTLFVILAESSITPQPSKRTFDDPSPFDEFEACGQWRFLALREPDLAWCIFAAADDLQFATCGLPDGDFATPGVTTIGPEMEKGPVFHSGCLDHFDGAIPVLRISRLDVDGHWKPNHIRNDVPLAPFDLLPCIVTAGPPFSVVLTV